MAANAADRDLLFGLLALQIGLIDQSKLVAAFQAWTLDKARSLADHLVAHGDLDREQRALLEALVAQHLKKHGDAEKSLAAIPAGRSTRESLARLGDPDLGALIDQLAPGSTLAEAEDPDRTSSYSVGTATSDGQRFRVLRPHAQGGLGAVFVALDTELHREVALKQILDHHADEPTSRQRFLIEAEITGGLEHPGIVPVYGLGNYGDGRPFYAMRFIKGDSLKEAIERFHADESLKKDPGRRSLELRKLLRRFTDVCNAIDYAHSRGVLHRDIKPGNIIVGRYGETLVVDWGLAKALGQVEPGVDSGERTLIPSSASGSAETLPGSALGTPAYMSPEQAFGDLDRLGPRSDVYSLGATLYCLLIGRPPAEGDEIGELLRRVQRGGFPTPRQLDSSIDPALEAVCLRAMATNPEDRYPTCRALAEDIERWMADEAVSAWREPLLRQARRWARRHRPAVTGAAAAVLVGFIGLASAAAVYLRQRQAQTSRLELALGEVSLLREQAQADPEGDPVKWHAALQAFQRAEDLLGPLIDVATQREVRELGGQIATATQAAERDAELLRDVVDVRSAEGDDSYGFDSFLAYEKAFRRAEIDVDELGPEAAGAKIKARPKRVARLLAAALDSWAAQRRNARPEDADGWKRLVATAEAADLDETRNRLRHLWSEPDLKSQRDPLLKLAREADPKGWPPASLSLLARALEAAGEHEAAVNVLHRAQAEHPDDLWMNYQLAKYLAQLHPPRTQEVIRFYSVARALRSETAHQLAHLLQEQGEIDEAMAIFRDLVTIRPNVAQHWACYGAVLQERGDSARAGPVLDKAVELLGRTDQVWSTDGSGHALLGSVFGAQGKLPEAIAAFRESIRINPSFGVHNNLGNVLLRQGKLDDAIAAYREAIRLKPDFAMAHYNLGSGLRDQGKLAEAIAEYRDSIRLKPEYAEAHCNLGLVLSQQGQFREALAELRRGHELGSRGAGWPYPSAQWVRRAERLVALERRLPAVLRGDDKASDAAEGIGFADLANKMKRFALSARLYSESLRADPKLAEDMKSGDRYNAACAAALAGAGQGDDKPPLDEKEKARWRKQALDWLHADLAFWTREAETGKPEGKALVSQKLQHWKADTDLAGIREETALQTLPEDERKACRALWAEVDALLAKARAGTASGPHR
jgi:serine/threonine-protein kinase